MIHNKIELITVKAAFGQSNFDANFNGLNAVFSTEKTDFGGYSHFFSIDILKSLYNFDDSKTTKIHINERDQIKENTIGPIIIHTPIIKNDHLEAESLMKNIISLSLEKSYNKIALTHFIKIKGKFEQNLKGIIDSIKEYSSPKTITIVIAVDEDRFEEFNDIINNYNKTKTA
jgi:hypothetical protein